MKWATYTSTRALTGAATGLAAGWAAGLSSKPHCFGRDCDDGGGRSCPRCWMPAFAALDAPSAEHGESRRTSSRLSCPLVFLAVPFYAPLVAVLAFAYRDVSPWTLPLFFGAGACGAAPVRPLSGAARTRRGTSRRRTLGLSVRTSLSLPLSWRRLDARDRYTAGHSAAVAIYARDIAERLGLSEEQQQLAHLCGLVHDIGKIGLPPACSRSRGPHA